MKIWVNLMVLLFLFFLSTPSLVACLGIQTDLTSFYEASEEEESHNQSNSKEFNHFFKVEIDASLAAYFSVILKNIFYCSNHLIKGVLVEILIPPPDFI
jgi:hypothetical protein